MISVAYGMCIVVSRFNTSNQIFLRIRFCKDVMVSMFEQKKGNNKK